jgi:hypothetical protein
MVIKNKQTFFEYLRLFTPVGVFLIGIIGFFIQREINTIDSNLVEVKESVKDVDNKLFKHLTNDEMHMPRTVGVTKAEFMMYQTMRDEQIKDIKDAVLDIKNLIKK